MHSRGVTKWYVYDGLGSVVGETDFNGSLTSSPKYDVYGLVRSNSGTASSKMGFVGGLGHLSEANTGLIYMRARYYDPQQGRFESEDPDFNGVNWFVYCNDDPVNKVDQTGKEGGIIGIGLTVFLYIEIAEFIAKGFGWKPSERVEHFLQSAAGASLVLEIIGRTIENIAKLNEACEAGETAEAYKRGAYIVAANGVGVVVAALAIEQLVLLFTMVDDDDDGGKENASKE